jgi:hypothetical protein
MTGRTIVLTAIGLLLPFNVMGQDVCIPDPVSTNVIKGQVLFEVDGRRTPLRDVTLEVAPYGYQKPALTKVITGDDGRFDLSTIPPGRYYLTAHHPAVIGLRVEVRLKKKMRQRIECEIEVVLQNDPSRPCGGATAALRQANEQRR